MEKKNSKKKITVTSRKVIHINGSCYVCLPKEFVERHGIKPGDRVMMGVGENLKISPLEG